VGRRRSRPLLGVVDTGHADRQRVVRVVGEVQNVVDQRSTLDRQQVPHLYDTIRYDAISK